MADTRRWQSLGVINSGIAVLPDGRVVMVYRGLGVRNPRIPVSVEYCDWIGLAFAALESGKFDSQFHYLRKIAPNDTYQTGFQDPRVTKIGDTYYISLTAFRTLPYELSSGRRVSVRRVGNTVFFIDRINQTGLVLPFGLLVMVPRPDYSWRNS